MAFNPFTYFRKHQKVIYATLTILCMVTFIMCSGVTGAKDLFLDVFPQWLGRARAETVTTLYGETVTAYTIRNVQTQRRIARDALSYATGLAMSEVNNQMQEMERPRPGRPRGKDEHIALLGEQRQVLQSRMYPWSTYLSEFYNFEQLDNVLDFLIWLHQANQIGVQFSSDDVNLELRRDAFGKLADNNELKGKLGVDINSVWAAMLQSGQYPKLTVDQIRAALADEFRVRVAQKALLGYDVANPPGQQFSMRDMRSPLVQVPAPVTPYEFHDYIDRQLTAVKVALVPVPVKPQPTGGELSASQLKEMRAMFATYKDTEPAPDRATPAFKEPRRVRVEWVSLAADDPAYRKEAAKVAPVLRAVQQIGGPAASLLPGPLALAARATEAALPLAFDTRFYFYVKQMERLGELDMTPWSEPGFALAIYSNRARPAAVAGMLGTRLGDAIAGQLSLAGLVDAAAAPVLLNQKELEPFVAKETVKRAAFNAGEVLSGALPYPFAAIGALWQYAHDRKDYLPVEAIRDQVEARDLAGLTRALTLGRMAEFRKELDKKAATNAQQAAKWAEDQIKQAGFEHYVMKDPKDRYEVVSDPFLSRLREAYTRQNGFDVKAEGLSQQLFALNRRYAPRPFPADGQGGERWDNADQFIVYWLAEDQEARAHKSMEEIKDRVEAALRQSEARKTTREAARALSKELADKAKGDLALVRQVALDKKLPPVIELTDPWVSRLTSQPVPRPDMSQSYEPYKFPSTIEFPKTQEWLDKLLALKSQGETVVLSDQPEKNYYVAVLLAPPAVPPISKFHSIYKEVGAKIMPNPLWNNLVEERQRKYVGEAMKELRTAAAPNHKLDDQGRIALAEDIRKQFEGGSSSEE